MEFVCRLCVPPSTALKAWKAVRTILFSGCCAVSEQPAVCVWNLNSHDSGFFAPYFPFMCRAQMRLAARYFAISSKKSRWELKKKLSLGANSSTSSPAFMPAST